MNVLLINGSPHKEGCTYHALCEVAKTLNAAGIETTIYHIGPAPVGGFLPAAQLRVEAVDIDTFACGRIVEIETPNGRERRRQTREPEALPHNNA